MSPHILLRLDRTEKMFYCLYYLLQRIPVPRNNVLSDLSLVRVSFTADSAGPYNVSIRISLLPKVNLLRQPWVTLLTYSK